MRSEAIIWAAVAAILGFLFIPIVVIVIYAFSAAPIPAWPIQGLIRHFRPEIERRIDAYARNPADEPVEAYGVAAE